jgi:hypothetical protein
MSETFFSEKAITTTLADRAPNAAATAAMIVASVKKQPAELGKMMEHRETASMLPSDSCARGPIFINQIGDGEHESSRYRDN